MESCLKLYTQGQCQNGIYFKRNMDDEAVLNQYCTNLRHFDDALEDSWNYLQEAGCGKRSTMDDEVILDQYCRYLRQFQDEAEESWKYRYLRETACNKRSNKVDLMTKEHGMLATTEFWNESRNFLRYINNIICSRIQNELTCSEAIKPYSKQFVGCFNFMYWERRPGLVQMLLAGPEKYFDRRLFCSSVLGIESCAYDAIWEACNETTSLTRTITEEFFDENPLIWDLARCDEVMT